MSIPQVSVDDLINGVEPKVVDVNIVNEETETERPSKKGKVHDRISADEYGADSKESKPDQESSPVDPYSTEEEEFEKEKEEAKAESADDEKVDGYGNEITAKERTYTESEVNKMIRERLARGGQGQQPTNAQVEAVKQEMSQSMSDPENATAEDWEVQLDGFVDKIVDRKLQEKQDKAQNIAKEAAEKAWQAEEMQKQEVFVEKFTTGMSKYKDFQNVVKDKPITDAMMIAARGFDNPASFFYAACKNHPQEIERISKMTDFADQAREIGRLDERMRKVTKTSGASRPLFPDKGDMRDSEKPKVDVDSMIEKDARMKLKQKRGLR